MIYPPFMNARQRRKARRIVRELDHVTPKNAKDISAAFLLDRALKMLNLQPISEEEHLDILMGGGTAKVGLCPRPADPLS